MNKFRKKAVATLASITFTFSSLSLSLEARPRGPEKKIDADAEAYKEYSRVLSIFEGISDTPDYRVEGYTTFLIGYLAQLRGDNDVALEFYKTTAKAFPDSTYVSNSIAAVWYAITGGFDEQLASPSPRFKRSLLMEIKNDLEFERQKSETASVSLDNTICAIGKLTDALAAEIKGDLKTAYDLLRDVSDNGSSDRSLQAKIRDLGKKLVDENIRPEAEEDLGKEKTEGN
jgi:hypothetical protein